MVKDSVPSTSKVLLFHIALLKSPLQIDFQIYNVCFYKGLYMSLN